jgi:5-methyltetrahydrofolate--homocysteine methyltransferase
MWNLDHPDRVRAVHQSFVDAGSDPILTNSLGADRSAAQPTPAPINKTHVTTARWLTPAASQPLVTGSRQSVGGRTVVGRIFGAVVEPKQTALV